MHSLLTSGPAITPRRALSNFPKLLDVIADLYLNPTVPKDELEKEKGVIVEEINMYKDMPMRNVGNLLDAVMYGKQAAGLPIAGSEKTVRAMKRDTFLNYRNKHYVPKATAVIVAGDIDPSKVLKKVKTYFSTLSPARKVQKPPVLDTQKSPHVGIEYKKSSQAHFRLGFRSVAAASKDIPAIEVLKAVLGGGMSSRLFKKLRDEMGVCYYVRAEAESNLDHGKFVIASGVDNTRIGIGTQRRYERA